MAVPTEQRRSETAFAPTVLVVVGVIVVALIWSAKPSWTPDWVAAIATVAAVIVALFLVPAQRWIEHRDERAEQTQRDLDETRRLTYAALLCVDRGLPPSPELGATLANALAHHSGVLGASDAVQLVNDMYVHVAGQTQPGLRRDLQNIVRSISDRLGEDPKAWDRPLGTDRPFPHPDD